MKENSRNNRTCKERKTALVLETGSCLPTTCSLYLCRTIVLNTRKKKHRYFLVDVPGCGIYRDVSDPRLFPYKELSSPGSMSILIWGTDLNGLISGLKSQTHPFLLCDLTINLIRLAELFTTASDRRCSSGCVFFFLDHSFYWRLINLHQKVLVLLKYFTVEFYM